MRYEGMRRRGCVRAMYDKVWRYPFLFVGSFQSERDCLWYARTRSLCVVFVFVVFFCSIANILNSVAVYSLKFSCYFHSIRVALSGDYRGLGLCVQLYLLHIIP